MAAANTSKASVDYLNKHLDDYFDYKAVCEPYYMHGLEPGVLCSEDHEKLIEYCANPGKRFEPCICKLLKRASMFEIGSCKDEKKAVRNLVKLLTQCQVHETVVCLTDDEARKIARTHRNLELSPQTSSCGPAKPYHIAKTES